jgi:hypothetical protein
MRVEIYHTEQFTMIFNVVDFKTIFLTRYLYLEKSLSVLFVIYFMAHVLLWCKLTKIAFILCFLFFDLNKS